jgi:hypothetical protein
MSTNVFSKSGFLAVIIAIIACIGSGSRPVSLSKETQEPDESVSFGASVNSEIFERAMCAREFAIQPTIDDYRMSLKYMLIYTVRQAFLLREKIDAAKDASHKSRELCGMSLALMNLTMDDTEVIKNWLIKEVEGLALDYHFDDPAFEKFLGEAIPHRNAYIKDWSKMLPAQEDWRGIDRVHVEPLKQ